MSTMIARQADTVAARKQRWLEFMAPGAAPGFLFHVGLDTPATRELQASRPPLRPEAKQARIDWILRKYDFLQEQAEWLHDDRVPYLDNLTGTEIFAEACGCRVHRAPGHMPFALPCVRSPREAGRLRVPRLEDSSLAYLFEIADAVRLRAGSEACMRLVDIQSPMDIAALIWNKEEIFAAMLEAPQAVEELAAKTCDLLIAFLDEWFARYGTDYLAHCPDYFMRGGLTLSEDEIGAVSPEMFQRFFLPPLVRLSRRYGGIGIHCCADAQHQWPGFAAIPGLRLLNLSENPGVTRFKAEEAVEFFGNRVVHMHGGWSLPRERGAWLARHPDVRLAFEVPAEDRDEAGRLCAELLALRG